MLNGSVITFVRLSLKYSARWRIHSSSFDNDVNKLQKVSKEHSPNYSLTQYGERFPFSLFDRITTKTRKSEAARQTNCAKYILKLIAQPILQ